MQRLRLPQSSARYCFKVFVFPHRFRVFHFVPDVRKSSNGLQPDYASGILNACNAAAQLADISEKDHRIFRHVLRYACPLKSSFSSYVILVFVSSSISLIPYCFNLLSLKYRFLCASSLRRHRSANRVSALFAGVAALLISLSPMDTHRPSYSDVDRGTTLIVLTAVFTFFSTITTIIRIFIRAVKNQLGWDDFSIALAAILILIQLTFTGLAYHAGDGHHSIYLKTSQTIAVVKWIYMNEFLLFLIICLTKISICLFILRIKNTGWLKWCLYTLMAGLILTTLVCEIILFTQCQPIRAFWDRSAGKCWNLAIYNGSIWAQIGMFCIRVES